MLSWRARDELGDGQGEPCMLGGGQRCRVAMLDFQLSRYVRFLCFWQTVGYHVSFISSSVYIHLQLFPLLSNCFNPTDLKF